MARRLGFLAALVLACGALVTNWSCYLFTPVVAESAKIRVRSRAADPKPYEAVLAAGEAVHGELAREFGREPDERLTILFVPTLEDSLGGYAPWLFGFGDCLIFAEDAAPLLPGPVRPLLKHEMAHFFIMRTIGTDVRIWFNEGLAEYLCFERGWGARSLGNVGRYAEALDAETLLALVRADVEAYRALDARLPKIVTFSEKDVVVRREFRPGRHYALARLVCGALDFAGWPILREDPTPRIERDPAAALEAVRRYARRAFWEKVLPRIDLAKLDGENRGALAEALGRADADVGAAALAALVRDAEPAVRDRAALALFRRGDRSYADAVAKARAALPANFDDIVEEDAGFAVDLDEAARSLERAAATPSAGP